MGRRLRSRLDLLFPVVHDKVESSQRRQKNNHDNSRPIRSFKVGDLVYAEDFRVFKSKWMKGIVVKVTGPLSYLIELLTGGTV